MQKSSHPHKQEGLDFDSNTQRSKSEITADANDTEMSCVSSGYDGCEIRGGSDAVWLLTCFSF